MSILRTYALALLLAAGLGCGDDDDTPFFPDPPDLPEDPCAGAVEWDAFNTGMLPVEIPVTFWSFQNLSFDPSGNLLVPEFDGTIHMISRSTGEMTTVAENIGDDERLMTVVYDADADLYYAGNRDDPGTIYRVSPESGASSPWVDIATGRVPQMLFAPDTFGEHAGKLLVVSYGLSSGVSGIIALDPRAPINPTIAFALNISDMEFARDGKIYVADARGDQITRLSADGTVDTLASDIINPIGIAVGADCSTLFVVLEGNPAQIVQISLPDGTVTPLGDFTITRGAGPAGIAHDGHDTLLFLRGVGTIFLDFLDLAAPPPVPTD
jgi:hypothetical protein